MRPDLITRARWILSGVGGRGWTGLRATPRSSTRRSEMRDCHAGSEAVVGDLKLESGAVGVYLGRSETSSLTLGGAGHF